MVIEDKGFVRGYCVAKLSNEVHSLRLDVSVPRGYPAQAPTFRVIDSSLLTAAQLSDIITQLKELADRRAQKSRTCLQESFLLVSRLLADFEVVEEPLINLDDSSGDEGSEVAAEESTKYPASCGHCWHPNGRFVFFACYDMTEVRPEADDCFVYVKEKRPFRPDVGINSGEYEQNPASLMYYDPTITQKPSRRSSTSVLPTQTFDFSDFLPLNKALCCDLQLMTEHDLAGMCEHNAAVCGKHSRPELAKCWKVLAYAWRMFSKGADCVILHPLGVPLVLRMVDHFLRLNDQTSAALLCLYVACEVHQYLQAGGEASWILSTKTGSDDEPGDSLLSLLASGAGIASVLSRWGCYLQRAQLLKLLARVNETIGWEAAPQSLGYTCEVQHTVDYLSCAEDEASVVGCKDCKAFSFVCVVCQQVVNGLSLVCRGCGHGGHLKHLKKWFGSESICPTGCGCACQAFS